MQSFFRYFSLEMNGDYILVFNVQIPKETWQSLLVVPQEAEGIGWAYLLQILLTGVVKYVTNLVKAYCSNTGYNTYGKCIIQRKQCNSRLQMQKFLKRWNPVTPWRDCYWNVDHTILLPFPLPILLLFLFKQTNIFSVSNSYIWL